MRSWHAFRTLCATVFLLGSSACGEAVSPPPPPPPAVEFHMLKEQPVALAREFVARTRAREDAALRARITGTIIERHFEEGEVVEENALLFRIDPRPYRTALQSAQAGLADARAALDLAQKNLARGRELAPDGYISQAELDELQGARNQATAAVASAEAAIEQARLDLEFTEIRAPFAGTAGRSELSIGDLVNPSSGALVTLVQTDPMLVDFDVDERSLARSLQNNQERANQGLEPTVYTPRLKLVTGDMYGIEGEIDYADNRINTSTGTVSVTARFDNPEGVLLPGQFVRIQVQRGEAEMRLLVPQPSVLEDMQGRYVFIVDETDAIQRRNVTVGPRYGVDWVVEDGLAAGDRVVVNGIQKVRSNMKVTPSPVEAMPHQASDATE